MVQVTDTDDWTMLGRVMRALQDMDEGDGVLGFAVWEQRIADEVDVPVRTFKSKEYEDFKKALGELTDRGFLRVVAGRNSGMRSKMTYGITDEGDTWWNTVAATTEGPGRGQVEVPRKTWIGRGKMSAEMWKQIQRDFKAGRIRIAVRDVVEENRR